MILCSPPLIFPNLCRAARRRSSYSPDLWRVAGAVLWLAGEGAGQVMTGPNKLTKTIQGIAFDSAYDNGSLANVVSGGTNIFNGTLFTETGEQGTAKYYINAVNAATPFFNNGSAQTSQLAACLFIESYFWNQWGSSVMALTPEGHFYRRQTDGAWITAADYPEIGAALAHGLLTFFPLHAASEPGLKWNHWIARFFTPGELTSGGVTSEMADPDGDGTGNLME